MKNHTSVPVPPVRCADREPGVGRRLTCGAAVCSLIWLNTLTGCTKIHVRKVGERHPNPVGLRYSLPKPYIQVVPKPDGTADVSVLTLPDRLNTYAVDATSYFASHTLDVTLKRGMLEKVQTIADSSGAVEKAGTTAGEFVSQAVAARQKEVDAAATAEAERQKAAREALAAAEKAVTEARTAHEAAKAKVRKLEELAGRPDLTDEQRSKLKAELDAARVAEAEAEARLKEGEKALEELRARGGRTLNLRPEGGNDTADVSSGMQPAATAPTPSTGTTTTSGSATSDGRPDKPSNTFGQAWGGVLYAVHETGTPLPMNSGELNYSLRLAAVRTREAGEPMQKRFATTAAPKPSEGSDPSKPPKLAPESTLDVRIGADQKITFVLTADKEILQPIRVRSVETVPPPGGPPPEKVNVQPEAVAYDQFSKKRVGIVIPRLDPNITYKVTVEFKHLKPDGKEAENSDFVYIRVLP